MLLRRTESHDFFDAAAVVPRTVEEHDFPFGGQVSDIALVIPLAALPFTRRGQRRDAGDARVQVFGDPLDGSALARSVAAFEDNHETLPRMPQPLLKHHAFRLQSEQFGFAT